MASLKKFEYDWHTLRGFLNIDILDWLNKKGEEGWQVVSLKRAGEYPDHYETILMREVPQ